MDPITGTLAAATFVSLAKDLVDIASSAATLYVTIRDSAESIQSFQAQCNSLAASLGQFKDREADLEQVHESIQTIREIISALGNAGRIKKAMRLGKLKEAMAKLEIAKSNASLAIELMTNRDVAAMVDTIALLRADQDTLCQQLRLVVALLQRQDHLNTAGIESTKSLAQRQASDKHMRTLFDNGCTAWSWLSNRLRDLLLEGMYRHWTWSPRMRQCIPSDSPLLTAIKFGEVNTIRYILKNHIKEDDAIEQAAPSRYMPSRKTNICPLYEYALVYSIKPLEVIKLMTLRDPQAVLAFLVDEQFYRPWRFRRQRVQAYLWLIEEYNLDEVLEWPTVNICDHLMPYMFIFPGEKTMPLMRSIAVCDFIAERMSRRSTEVQQRCLTIAFSTDPCSDLIPMSEFIILFGLTRRHENRPTVQMYQMDWLLSKALYCTSSSDEFRWSRKMLLEGASPRSIVHGRTPILAILTSILRLHRWADETFELSLLLQQWTLDLAKSGHDIAAYVKFEQTCLDEGLYAPEWNHSHLGHRLIYSSIRLQDCIILDFEVSFRLSIQLEDAAKMAQEDLVLPGSFPEDNQGQVSSSISKTITKKIASPDLEAYFGYRPPLETQDDHGLVARSCRRSHQATRRRSSSQPRSLEGCTWKFRSSGWLSHCHYCPFQAHRRLHWLGPRTTNKDYLEEMTACLTGPVNKSFEECWAPTIWCKTSEHDDPEEPAPIYRHWQGNTMIMQGPYT